MNKKEELDYELMKKKALEQFRSGKSMYGRDGAFAPLIKSFLEATLEAEMESHLDDNLMDEAQHLLNTAIVNSFHNPKEDLLTGKAGEIVGLTCLYGLLNEKSILNLAVNLGDQIIENAVKTPFGYSWGSHLNLNEKHLTGFSHGAAGIGYALLELSKLTGDFKYIQAAQQAFSYEGQWFNADRGN